MDINWEIVTMAAFGAIGIIEYVKGFFPQAKGFVWRLAMPPVCILLSAVGSLFPVWVMVGIMAFSMTQMGYDLIVNTVKSKLGAKTKDEGAGK